MSSSRPLSMTEVEQSIRLNTLTMKELITLRKRLAGMVERYTNTDGGITTRVITKARRLDQINRRIAQLEGGAVIEETAPVIDEKFVEMKREINRLMRDRREATQLVNYTRERLGDRFHTEESLRKFEAKVEAIDAKLAAIRGEVIR